MAAEFPWQLRTTGTSGVPDDANDLGDVSTAAGTGVEAAVPDAEAAVPDAEEYRLLLDAAAQVLDRVDRALGELADGSYGRCRECGAVIADDILASDPTTQRCAEHATAQDPAG